MATHRTAALIGALILAAGLAPAALAQTALGDGRALERKNAKKYPQSDQPKGGRDFAAEVQFRNAIVTGNAPGGSSFRGNAGYSAPNDFRGRTGSDDLYTFRRDSFYSGLSGQGIRGTEALQYQFAMTTGSSVPKGIVGSLGVGRAAGSGAAATLTKETAQRDEQSGTDWLRSPSSYTATRSLKPTALGERPRDETSFYRLMSSSLLGLKVQTVDMSRKTGLPTSPTAPGAATPPAPGTPGAPGTPAKPASPTGPNTPANPADSNVPKPAAEDPTAAFRTSYEQVIERLAAWKRQDEGGVPARTPDPGAKPGEADPPRDGDRPAWELRVEALRRHLLGLNAREVNEKDRQPLTRDDTVSVLNPETLRMLREGGGKVRVLAEVPNERASLPLYLRAMAAGQELLAAEKYFDAEDRFSRALAVRARDPAAQAGRIHAQLGAGMFLSASINLRELVVTAPETAGVRYDAALLPAPKRLEQVIVSLREKLAPNGDEGLASRGIGRRELGFLLAYLGFQTGNTKDIETGLAAVTRDATDSDEDKLILRSEKYLRGVWLGEMPPEIPADAVPTAPTTPTTPTPTTPGTPASATPTPTPPGSPASDKKPAATPSK